MSDDTPKEPGDYEVGYCKPPAHSRIKPGEVRNPRGRPKGTRNLKTDFGEAMAAPMTIKVNGKPQRLSAQQALIKSMIVAAMKGDIRAQAKSLDLSIRLFGDETEASDAKKLAEDDQAILDAYLASIGVKSPSDEA